MRMASWMRYSGGGTLTLLFALLSLKKVGALEVGQAHQSVVALDKSTFRIAIEDPANPFWLLKFYAPWCGHCKHLAPVLDRVATAVAGRMAIGKIDCTVEKKLCDEHKIHGYPTLKFSYDGEIHDYPGGRSEADLKSFSARMNRPAVSVVGSLAEVHMFADQETEEGVVFVAYHPTTAHVVGTDAKLQSSLLTQVFSQVARKNKMSGYFLLLDPPKEEQAGESSQEQGETAPIGAPLGQTGPFICRIEANVAPHCYENIPDITTQDLMSFFQKQNIATVTALGPHNFGKVGRNGRPLVIGVVDASNKEQLIEMKYRLSLFATQGPEELRNQYYYGWFDGKSWQRFLEQFHISPSDVPQVFLLNVPIRTYWLNATYGMNVEGFLIAVNDGTIPSQIAGKQGFDFALHRFYQVMSVYKPWSYMAVVFFFLALAIMIAAVVSPGEDFRPPYPKPDAAPSSAGAVASLPEPTSSAYPKPDSSLSSAGAVDMKPEPTTSSEASPTEGAVETETKKDK